MVRNRPIINFSHFWYASVPLMFYTLEQSGMPDFGRSRGQIVAKVGRNTIGMKTNPSQPVLEYFGNFSILLTPVLHMGVAGVTLVTAT